MQNTNSDNQVQQNNDQQSQPNLTNEAQKQAEVVLDSAKAQVNNIGVQAQSQVSNIGQAGVAQVQNLGQAGAAQVQNLGQEGVRQVNSLFNQFTQPLNTQNQQQQPAVTKDEKVYATISYIPFVAILSIIIKPDSAYVRLHSRQGLLLTVLFLFSGLFAAIVTIFGLIGQLLGLLIGLIPLACIVIGAYSMYLAMVGYWWKIPVLSAVADLIPVEAMAKVSKENITGQVGIAKNDFDNRQETIVKENQEKFTNTDQTPTGTNVNNVNQEQSK